MGPQGSGKGTQSERLRARLCLSSIATGELFRAAIKGGTALGTSRHELGPDDTNRIAAHMRELLARTAEIEGQIQQLGLVRTGVIDDTVILKDAEVIEAAPVLRVT